MPDWFDAIAFGPDVPPQPNDLTRTLLEEAQGVVQPWLINVAGTVGTGKSTMMQHIKTLCDTPIAFIQLDRIMESYPAYHTDYGRMGSEEAFKKWEPIAWATGMDVMRQLAAKNAPFVFELSATYPEFPGFLQAFKTHGYKIGMVHMSAPLDVAQTRVIERNAKRHVPAHYISDRLNKLETLLPYYREQVDLFIEVENSGNTPLQVDDSALLKFMSAGQ